MTHSQNWNEASVVQLTNLDGSIQVISSMPALQSLHFGGIEMTDQLLETLLGGNGSQMEELTFQTVHLSRESLTTLGKYTNLKALGIADCTGVRNLPCPK